MEEIDLKISEAIAKNANEKISDLNQEVTKYRKEQGFIYIIGLCFIFTLITAFILTWCNIIDFNIPNQSGTNIIMTFVGSYLLFMINWFFIFSITLKLFDNKIIILLLGYTPLWILCLLINIFFVNLGIFSSTVIPFLYMFVVNFKCKFIKILDLLKRFAIIISIFGIYQLISGVIKLKYFKQLFELKDFKTYFFLSFDLILFFILIYMGVRLYELVGTSSKRFSIVSFLSKIKSIFRHEARSEESKIDLSDMTRKQQAVFILMAQGYQLFQLMVVLLIGFVNNRLIEVPIMLIVFWIGRKALSHCWHSEKLWICSIVTFISFYILSQLAFPLSVSLFSCIALSAMFTYVLSRVGIIQEEYDELKEEKQRHKDFKLEFYCDENTIIEICSRKNISAEYTDLLVRFYTQHQSYSEIQVNYNYSERHIRRKICAAEKQFYN